jgi:DNA-binding beta-propeller fold protein YncE
VSTIRLGGTGGPGELALDAATHRLFVPRSSRVTVVDVERGRQLGDITGTPGVHGVALAPALGRGFTSNGSANTVTVFNLQTLHGSSDHPGTGASPGAIVYDPGSRRVFTMNADSNNATAIEAAGAAIAGTVPLGGRPAFAVTDGAGRLYVNLQDRNEIAALDARALRVIRRWPLAPCVGPTALAIDRTHGRLFSACRDGTMVAVDIGTGRTVGTLAIGPGVTAMRYDGGTGLIFAACSDGTLGIARQESPDAYRVVDVIKADAGIRALDLDPLTHRLYLAARDGGTAAAASQRHGAGALVILVYAR